MLQSNRFSRTATVYILAVLIAPVTLCGQSASAADSPLKAALEFCSHLLHDNLSPSKSELRGLKWFKANDGSDEAFALNAGPEESKLYVRDLKTSQVQVISDSEIEYLSYLKRFFLARPIWIGDETKAGKMKVTLTPSLVNARIVLSATVDKIPSEFMVSPEFGSTFTKDPTSFTRGVIQLNHLSYLTLVWSDILKIKIVAVEGGELPTVEYLRYLQNDRLPIGLDDVFLHDVFNHALGIQYLAAKKEWPLVKAAINEALAFADANTNLSTVQKKAFDGCLFELVWAIENSTSQLSKLDREKSYMPGSLTAHIDRFYKLLKAIPEQ